MQGFYAAAFEREMGCTEAELLRWLPGATTPAQLEVWASAATARLATGGVLNLRWSVLQPRRVTALVAFPRLAVAFEFVDVSEAERQAFMRRFDLYTQRGGG